MRARMCIMQMLSHKTSVRMHSEDSLCCVCVCVCVCVCGWVCGYGCGCMCCFTDWLLVRPPLLHDPPKYILLNCGSLKYDTNLQGAPEQVALKPQIFLVVGEVSWDLNPLTPLTPPPPPPNTPCIVFCR